MIALTVLCVVVALGLVDPAKMTEVFKNEAPLTIAALFVIGGALEASGAVDHIGRVLRDRLSGNTRWAILGFSVLTRFFSAWMNNTAIVAILLPVTLGFARSKDIAASRLLMPLSYCSILGGVCTLIGTSTNILVNGTLKDMKMEPMSMFELAPDRHSAGHRRHRLSDDFRAEAHSLAHDRFPAAWKSRTARRRSITS